jgi:hypothetical protein
VGADSRIRWSPRYGRELLGPWSLPLSLNFTASTMSVPDTKLDVGNTSTLQVVDIHVVGNFHLWRENKGVFVQIRSNQLLRHQRLNPMVYSIFDGWEIDEQTLGRNLPERALNNVVGTIGHIVSVTLPGHRKLWFEIHPPGQPVVSNTQCAVRGRV